jgi:hypothetical protein
MSGFWKTKGVKMERTNDPVRDAESYNADMENRPMRQYEGGIELAIRLDCFGKNSFEAEGDLNVLADKLRDYIECLEIPGNVEVGIERVRVEREI